MNNTNSIAHRSPFVYGRPYLLSSLVVFRKADRTHITEAGDLRHMRSPPCSYDGSQLFPAGDVQVILFKGDQFAVREIL